VRRLRVSIDAVWTAVAVALPAFAALLAPLSTVDLAYQVRTGDLILAGRAIPSVDPFTFSAAGLPWTVQQWGAAVLLAAGFSPAGWAGLLVLRAVIVGAIFALVLVACRASGASGRSSSASSASRPSSRSWPAAPAGRARSTWCPS
jgi:mannose/fructose/N-acetylgalactosamine-specific phosphotransferase system component IIC